MNVLWTCQTSCCLSYNYNLSKNNFLFFSSRLSGEEGRQFLPAVEKHFSRLGKATLVSLFHIINTYKAGGTSESPILILKLLISMMPYSGLVSCCFQAHITSPNAELSQAALQALGFCVYHSRVVSGVPGTFIYIFIHYYYFRRDLVGLTSVGK